LFIFIYKYIPADKSVGVEKNEWDFTMVLELLFLKIYITSIDDYLFYSFKV